MHVHDGAFRLEIIREPRSDHYYQVTIAGAGLRASVPVWDADAGIGLLAYLEDLAARGFDGWPGKRTFESLEGELHLSAIHDGHARLTIRLSPPTASHSWEATAVMTIEPGEQLRHMARDLREEFCSE